MGKNSLFPNPRPARSSEGLLDQYKLAVELWDRVRARRQQSNAFYVSINSAIIVATRVANAQVDLRVLAGAGIAICVFWIGSILNYASLADDKLSIIREFEEVLPSAPFSAETRFGGWLHHRHFTWVERCIPIAFAFLYASLLYPSWGR